MHHRFLAGPVLGAAASLLLAGCSDRPAEAPRGADTSRPIALTVDASDPLRGLFHAHLVIPAHPGAMTLAYPEWIPGEHAPSGPLVNVVDLHVTAAGKTLAWRRDPEQMFDIAVTVPAEATSVEADFDYVNAAGPTTDEGDASSPRALDLEWNRVVLYPKGLAAAAIRVDARVKLPDGWSYATALETAADGGKNGGTVDFREVTLEKLVDSPLIAGRYLRTYDLGTQRGAHHAVSIAGETAASVIAPEKVLEGWRRLIVEANALFGARHYDSYRFLLTMSDTVEGGRRGLEHHQSSLNGLKERGLTDENERQSMADLFPHEYTHSWDGKFRRPRSLATPDYQTPMHDDLLWVYEGLTEYLGTVLTARSGLQSVDDTKAVLARVAFGLTLAGRTWRPLVDTATAAPVLQFGPRVGYYRRRGEDYYTEGMLIWLEADVLIRQQTNGARSLDDFCQRFFGGPDTGPMVRPYDLDEVISTLNGVAARDWRAFFDQRVYHVAPEVPTGGITGSGYRLAFVDEKPESLGQGEAYYEMSWLAGSLGFNLSTKGDKIGDVRPGSPADKAGLLGGATLVAVDGRKYTKQVMEDALERAKKSTAPIELLVEADDAYRTVKVDWHQGAHYPVLERDPDKPDLLEKILAPRVKQGGAK